MKKLIFIMLIFIPIKVYAYNYIDINTVFDADIDISNIECLSIFYENPEDIEGNSLLEVDRDKYFKLNTKFKENAKIYSAEVCEDLLIKYKIDFDEKIDGDTLYLTLNVHDNRYKGTTTTSNRKELEDLLFPNEEEQDLPDDIIDIDTTTKVSLDDNSLSLSKKDKEDKKKEEKKKLDKENKKRKLVFMITYAIIGLFVLIVIFKAGINLIKANK